MRKTTILLITAAILAAMLLAGCNLNKVSIQDRIDMFFDDVNAGAYSSLYEHIHDDANDRNVSKTPTFWTVGTPFGDTGPHAYSSYSESSSSVTMTYTNGGGANETMTFTMKEDKKDTWFILKIVGNSTYLE